MVDPSNEWESRASVLETAHNAGFRLSEPQLGRLHRAGLIPSPRVRSLGRGKGTASEFPLGSADRLLRVLEVQRREHRLSRVAWQIWWEDGGDLSPPARAMLVQLAQDWERHRGELAGLLARDANGDPDAEEEMNALYREMESGRVSGVLGVARRNTGREGFSSVARVMLEALTGSFESYGDQEEPAPDGTPQPGTTGALVERAMGLDRGRLDHLANADPWFQGSSEDDFARLSRIFSRRPLSDYANTDDAALDQARVEVQGLLTIISTFTAIFGRMFGRAGFGLGTAVRALDLHTPQSQALVVLAWLALGEEPGLRNAMEEFAALVPAATATAELDKLNALLAEEVPALVPLFTDRAFAKALRDADYAEQRRAEIARISNEHRQQVDDFFKRHPEIHALTATIEGEQPQSA